jgi:large subunit ribosomal protein L17
MRHRKANVKLGRTASHRDAMLRNMVTSLFEYGRIRTTVSKAKALRPLADRLIGLAKGGKADLSALRRAAAVITKRSVLDKLFSEAEGRFADRDSGFTLMARLGLRPGDAAPMVILELTGAGQARAAVGGQGRKQPKAAAGDRARRVAQSAKKAAEVAEATAEETAEAPAEAAAPETAKVVAEASALETAEVAAEAPPEAASAEATPKKDAAKKPQA